MCNQKSISTKIDKVAKRYDDMIDGSGHSEYFGFSGFLNFGYWDNQTFDQKIASERLMEKLLSFIPNKVGKILDVACGMGGTTRYLKKYYSTDQITGINISDKQLARARVNVPGCNFLKMDATRLEFVDQSFDSVICVEAVFHFNTRLKFFKEAFRVLKPNGYLVLSDILMNLKAEQQRKYRHEKNYVSDLQAYEMVFKQTGFRDVNVVDATEACWKGHYWNVVRYIHQKFLSREIDLNELQDRLEHTYRRVPDTEYYILAVGRKE
jgi:ubiquinone/menaquinone biosynthesis C-methylase UbiE